MSGRLGRTLKLGALLAIRWTPVPWRLKWLAIWLASPKVLAVSVAVIPDDAGRVLLLRSRYSGLWQLPGGIVDAGEDMLSGVRRECREELGAAVTVERLTGLYAMRGAADMVAAFRCAPLETTPRLSVEHSEYRYVAPEAAPRLARMLIGDALRETDEVRIASLRTDHQV